MDKNIILSPPLELIKYIGGSDYFKIGKEFLNHFIRLGGLTPKSNVLDIGCGCGRIAVPLTGYLDAGTKYAGFDINRDVIHWCRENIQTKFPDFTFQLTDIKNAEYNPAGEFLDFDYTFPFEDESFNFIILLSVFTHILPKGLERYLSEISRVLKPGGRCFSTYYIFNPISKVLHDKGTSRFQYIHDGKVKLEFTHSVGHECFSINSTTPEQALAYNEDYLQWVYKKNDMVFGPKNIYYGRWCGRENAVSHQDIVVAEKQ